MGKSNLITVRSKRHGSPLRRAGPRQSIRPPEAARPDPATAGEELGEEPEAPVGHAAPPSGAGGYLV